MDFQTNTHSSLLEKASKYLSEHKNSSNIEAFEIIRDLLSNQTEILTELEKLKQSEAAIKEEQLYYDDIFNNQPAGLYRIKVLALSKWGNKNWSSSENPPYSMQLASDRFCEIIGITREEFANNPFIISDLIYPEDKKSFVRKNEEANRKLIPFHWEGRLLIRKKIIWIRLDSLPRPVEDGDVIWTGILYNTTEQKKAEAALNETRIKLEEVLEGANIGTLEWNVQTGKIKFNDIWAKNLGYSSFEIKLGQIFLGKNGWKTITHPEDIPYAEDMLKRHFSGELPYHKVEVRMRHKKGHWVWIRQEGKVKTWTPDGKPLLMYGVHTNISAQKEAEIALYNLKEELEERIAERTLELTKLNASLIESEQKLLGITMKVEERERNRFSSELHDGLGPLLSTIKLYFQWLADTCDIEKRKLIEEKGNVSIEMAIKTVRELAHGLSSQYMMEVGVIKAIRDFSKHINDTRVLTIHFHTNTQQRFDDLIELMLYRISTELIKNTLTHANATTAKISFVHSVENKTIEFEYSDDGKGFESDKSGNENTGLGFVSIRKRVEVLKGDIQISSKPGQGMVAKIIFPIE